MIKLMLALIALKIGVEPGWVWTLITLDALFGLIEWIQSRRK